MQELIDEMINKDLLHVDTLDGMQLYHVRDRFGYKYWQVSFAGIPRTREGFEQFYPKVYLDKYLNDPGVTLEEFIYHIRIKTCFASEKSKLMYEMIEKDVLRIDVRDNSYLFTILDRFGHLRWHVHNNSIPDTLQGFLDFYPKKYMPGYLQDPGITKDEFIRKFFIPTHVNAQLLQKMLDEDILRINTTLHPRISFTVRDKYGLHHWPCFNLPQTEEEFREFSLKKYDKKVCNLIGVTYLQWIEECRIARRQDRDLVQQAIQLGLLKIDPVAEWCSYKIIDKYGWQWWPVNNSHLPQTFEEYQEFFPAQYSKGFEEVPGVTLEEFLKFRIEHEERFKQLRLLVEEGLVRIRLNNVNSYFLIQDRFGLRWWPVNNSHLPKEREEVLQFSPQVWNEQFVKFPGVDKQWFYREVKLRLAGVYDKVLPLLEEGLLLVEEDGRLFILDQQQSQRLDGELIKWPITLQQLRQASEEELRSLQRNFTSVIAAKMQMDYDEYSLCVRFRRLFEEDIRQVIVQAWKLGLVRVSHDYNYLLYVRDSIDGQFYPLARQEDVPKTLEEFRQFIHKEVQVQFIMPYNIASRSLHEVEGQAINIKLTRHGITKDLLIEDPAITWLLQRRQDKQVIYVGEIRQLSLELDLFILYEQMNKDGLKQRRLERGLSKTSPIIDQIFHVAGDEGFDCIAVWKAPANDYRSVRIMESIINTECNDGRGAIIKQ